MTAIIFGASGQDGFYLKALLQKNNINVIGVARSEGFLKVDLTSFNDVSAFIQKFTPDFIFHFAANSTTSHEAWQENHDTISTGSINILEAVKQFAPGCKVFLSGSGLQFKNNAVPIKESDSFDASSIYSVSRIHSVYAARYYRKLGLKVYVGYFFHHDSPQRSERHINKKILSVAKKISEGSEEKLTLGDVSVKKEFGFAGDIVEAVWTLVQQDEIFEAVIGTGKAYTIEEWVDICFSLYGLDYRDHLEKAQGFVPDFKLLVSDPSTVKSLGWKPQIDIKSLAKLML